VTNAAANTTTEARQYPIDVVLAKIAIRPDILATLRRGIGRSLEDAPGSWPYVMEVVGSNRFREEAAHVTLGLFALHHQSQDPGSMNRSGWGFGRACRALKQRRAAGGLSDDGVERRFRSAVGADSLSALATHLRGLVTMLRGENLPIDYRQLYWDLAAWRAPERRDRVALQWARDYFSSPTEDRSEEEPS
jgi:CRISPR system Cascade subunit CasB